MRKSTENSRSVSLQKSSFDRRTVHVGFLVAKVTSGQLFLKLLLCTMPFIILLILVVRIHSSTIEANYFSTLQTVQTFSGPRLAFCSVGIRALLPSVKWPKHELDHSHYSSEYITGWS